MVTLQRLIFVILFFISLPITFSVAQEEKKSEDEIILKKCVVFLGNEESVYATGFLVSVQNIIHLVTAKHVVMNKNNLCVFLILRMDKLEPGQSVG